eukprot:jgi/Picsp_1/5357/NSC_02718-R1_component of oligomeric golgi complex 6
MAAPVAPGLNRKLRKVLDTRTDRPDVSKDLAALSQIYHHNTAYDRRNIRSTIENGIVSSNVKFLEEAGRIMASIDSVGQDLESLGSVCESMSRVLHRGQMQASGLLDEIQRLEESIRLSERRASWLEVFQNKYQPSKEETEKLKEGTIDDGFFEALKHIQIVHGNCRALGLSHHHKAGLDLLDELSSLQDEAFKNLCSWVQAECLKIDAPESPEINNMMPNAMKALRSRPPLYSYCAEEIALSRRNAVFQKFIEALSRGRRPIEVHAADPWRYANDMLAWVHSAIASEMELVATLFEGCYDVNDKASTIKLSGVDQSVDDGPESAKVLLSLEEIMDSIFESVCRPLKMRLEQILMSSPTPLLNFQLSTLFRFYLNTIDPVVGSSSQLSSTLRSCQAAAEKSLRDQLKQRGERLVRQPPLPPPDLCLPDAYMERVGTAVEILKFSETSMLQAIKSQKSGDHDAASDEEAFGSLLLSIVEPIIESIYVGADALNPSSNVRLDDSGKQMDPSDQYIYVMNCISYIQRQLNQYGCPDAVAKEIQDHLDRQMARVANTEVEKIVQKTALKPQDVGLRYISEPSKLEEGSHTTVMSPTDLLNPDTTGSQDDKASPDVIANGAMELFSVLSDPQIIPDLTTIRDHMIRAETLNQMLSDIVDVYTRAYHMASSSNLISTLHPPEDVKTLLGATSC